jgi:hypothetical protein
MTLTMPGRAVTDYRLVHGLCVWCGGDLTGDDDLYCRYGHMEAWHAAVNGHALPTAQPVTVEPTNRPMPPGAVPAHPASEPWWRPRTDRPHHSAEEQLRRLLGVPTSAQFAALVGLLSEAECRQLEDDYPARPGRYTPEPEHCEYADDTPILGERTVADCRYALAEIDPEPLPRTPWPAQAIAAMTRGGFEIADDTSAVPPVRWCPRCGETAAPVVRNGRWAALTPKPGGGEPPITVATGPRMFCSACRAHYPGPDLVPMTRPANLFTTPRGGAELAVVSGDHTYRYTVSGMEASLGRVGPVLWGTMWEAVAERLQLWPCALPGCSAVPRTWYLLGAAMAWYGRAWIPRDGEALRLGLCPRHTYELASTMTVDPRSRVDLMSRLFVN